MPGRGVGRKLGDLALEVADRPKGSHLHSDDRHRSLLSAAVGVGWRWVLILRFATAMMAIGVIAL
jgi:hypothetical protein